MPLLPNRQTLRRLGIRLPKPPAALIAILILATIASWIPLVLGARARVSKSEQPRIHLVQDMDNQPKFRAQDANPIFADGRAMRLPPQGVVARGQLDFDDHFFRGYTLAPDAAGKTQIQYRAGLPAQVQLSETLLRRGQKQFVTYCAPCHGLDGAGNGPINRRALELAAQSPEDTKWIPAASLHSDEIRGRAEGHLFNTITNGIRSMPAYGPQLNPDDRWAVVAYVRALQLSQHAPASSLAPEVLPTLR